ncbi:MAG: hypothetical protein GX665_12605 [Gammaproteobacteria bacterium]|nr:hypothetical protein [Gammaproteobacteria bacterium]
MTNRLTLCSQCRRMAWHAESSCLLCHGQDISEVPATPPSAGDHLDILRRYQAWRRGFDERTLDDTGISMLSVGGAIDAAIEAMTPAGNDVHVHMNPAGQTPPVGCPLVIAVGKKLVVCERREWAASHADSLVFYTPDGVSIHGRYPWTYQ